MEYLMKSLSELCLSTPVAAATAAVSTAAASNAEAADDDDGALLDEIKRHQIAMTDDDGTYQVYCSSAPQTEFECLIRGYIFKGRQLIYRGFPFTEEITCDNVSRLEKINLADFKISWSYEGTIVKFMHVDDKWLMTTHRKLNAFKSRWASKTSFGHLFVEALQKDYGFPSYEDFLDQLQTSRRYHFILINNADNRIVVRPELQEESIYLVLVTDDRDRRLAVHEAIGFIPINDSIRFDSVADLVRAVRDIDPFEKQGVLLFSEDYRVQYRVLNSVYADYANVRNNISCRAFCYCIARRDADKRRKYLELYPDSAPIAEWFESRIPVIAAELLLAYKNRYIMKNYVHVSQERHGLLLKIQQYYVETKRHHPVHKRITLADVTRIINTYEYPARLFKIAYLKDKPQYSGVGRK